MAVAIVIVALVLGSVLFHWLSPWWHTPIASNWGSIDAALDITLWICAAAFILLNLFMAWAIWRYRHQPGLAAWAQYVTVPKNAALVEANGEQWRWTFRLPGRDGVLGTAAASHIGPDNPSGINPKDPYGRDDLVVETSELHLQLNQPVKIVLRSKDVLHDFYVPEFRAKMDLVPGLITYLWLTPTRTGTFDILCAELCGTGHHQMRGTVVVDDAAAYARWLSEQMSFGQMQAEANQSPVKMSAR